MTDNSNVVHLTDRLDAVAIEKLDDPDVVFIVHHDCVRWPYDNIIKENPPSSFEGWDESPGLICIRCGGPLTFWRPGGVPEG